MSSSERPPDAATARFLLVVNSAWVMGRRERFFLSGPRGMWAVRRSYRPLRKSSLGPAKALPNCSAKARTRSPRVPCCQAEHSSSTSLATTFYSGRLSHAMRPLALLAVLAPAAALEVLRAEGSPLALHGSLRAAATAKLRPKQPKQRQ